MAILQQLRRAVDASGQSRYAISVAAGVNQSVLSRFMAGGAMDVKNLEAVAGQLGYTVELVSKDTDSKRAKRQAKG